MIRGLYTAATGMNAQTKKMDVIANDLANVNTTGYKKDDVVISAFEKVLVSKIGGAPKMGQDGVIGEMSLGIRVDEVYTQFTQGSLIKTDGLTDLALQGSGFFTVQTPAGEAYTRDGKFSISAEGMLVTQEGYAVVGQNGPIEIGEQFLNEGGELNIGSYGEITLDGEIIDMLALVDFADTRTLTKMASNLLQSTGEPIPFEGQVTAGFLEASTVNPVTAMVDMITVSRAYESAQKAIQVHDSLLGKAVNEVGRV